MIFKSIESILVVCTGNICRSPMGEGVLRHKLAQSSLSRISIQSAGTSGWVNREPTPEAVLACSEIGINISLLRSKPISEQMIRDTDLILAMERVHVNEIISFYNAPVDKIHLLGDFHPNSPGMDIEDPYGMDISRYRDILKLIFQSSEGLTDRLVETFCK